MVVSERCGTSAVSQLGSDNTYVRVGGIHALERIGYDSPQDSTTIIYVLGAFIRDRSRVHPSRPSSGAMRISSQRCGWPPA